MHLSRWLEVGEGVVGQELLQIGSISIGKHFLVISFYFPFIFKYERNQSAVSIARGFLRNLLYLLAS